MDDFLTVIGAVVAVAASLGAVAVVVEQFTLRARLRKNEAWAVAMVERDTDAERAAALTGIRLDATSRIVAGILLPVRRFAEATALTGATGVAVVVMMQEDPPVSGRAWLVVLVAAGLALYVRRAVRLYLERCRIASEYRRGLRVTRPRVRPLDLGGRALAEECAFSAGLAGGACALASGVGLALSAGAVDGWPLALALAGGAVVYATVDVLRIVARRRHPV